MSDERSAGRLQLILIGLVFIGPLVVAFVVYFGGMWMPGNSNVHGELLESPQLLPDDPFSTEIQTSRFRDKWSLIHITRDSCSDNCRESLYETRQVRQALNRDRDRVQRVLCRTVQHRDESFFESEHPRLTVIGSDFPACAVIDELQSSPTGGDVFLADPLGNVIIRYPPNTGMRGMHRDLKKLLRVSRIG